MKINAMRVVSYDVDEVRSSIAELNGIPIEEVSQDEAEELIYTWASEDLGVRVKDIIFQDEDGNDL
jgi:hypothetical protein